MSAISAARPAWRSLSAATRAFCSATSFLSCAWRGLGVGQLIATDDLGRDGRAEQAHDAAGSSGRTRAGRGASDGRARFRDWLDQPLGPMMARVAAESCGASPGRRHRASKLRWSAPGWGRGAGRRLARRCRRPLTGTCRRTTIGVPASGHDTPEGNPTASTSLDGLRRSILDGSMVRGGTGTFGAVWSVRWAAVAAHRRQDRRSVPAMGRARLVLHEHGRRERRHEERAASSG